MHRKHRNGGHEQGFTLVESLLVLSLVSVILSFTILKIAQIEEKHVTKNFFSQLTNDLLFAQQYAMSTKRSVAITFSTSNHYYRITQGSGNELLKRTYHEDIRVDPRTMGTLLIFHTSGSIQKSGMMGISYKEQENYRLVFQLGKGRFYVEAI
ncbi:competence type IV pilus minor pilin ComGD [Bacillus tianshenii]|nr:competence type IV pilus minor pilin ComGD [Bacillus tianshenii]